MDDLERTSAMRTKIRLVFIGAYHGSPTSCMRGF
jgi:hypothetical protein